MEAIISMTSVPYTLPHSIDSSERRTIFSPDKGDRINKQRQNNAGPPLLPFHDVALAPPNLAALSMDVTISAYHILTSVGAIG